MKTIGIIIKYIREQKELTLRELANKTNTQYAQISLIENGKITPSLSTLERICGGLDTPLEVLLMMSKVEIQSNTKLSKIFDGLTTYFSGLEDILFQINSSDNDTDSDDNDSNNDKLENPIIKGGGAANFMP